jgi:glycosyltransferase involved in cell wall biosynthesis
VRRILLLITDLEIGGTPTVVRELAVRLHQPPEVCVDVACLARRGPVAGQLAERGISVHALDASGIKDLGLFNRFVKLLRSEKYDTVFSFLVHANLVAAAASLRTRGVRFIQSIQTTQPNPRWHWWVQRIIHRAAGEVVVPSQSVARCAKERSGVPAEKIVIIPNAIDPAEFAELAARDTFTSARPVRIGFIGRLDPIKRIPDLIRATVILDAAAHLHLYGAGAQRGRLEQLMRTLQLESRVTFHGAVQRPHDALANMDVLVLPSEAEGFGLVLIEAMAAGVPVVATRAPGIRDVVRHGTTGLLVPIGSPEKLAEAIASATDNSALRRKLIILGKEHVHRRFMWGKVLPAYRKLLRIEPQ